VATVSPVRSVATQPVAAPAQPRPAAEHRSGGEHSGNDDHHVDRPSSGRDDHTSRGNQPEGDGNHGQSGDDEQSSPEPVATPVPTPQAESETDGHSGDGALEDHDDGADESPSGGDDSGSGSSGDGERDG
jgi:hypothetical protein